MKRHQSLAVLCAIVLAAGVGAVKASNHSYILSDHLIGSEIETTDGKAVTSIEQLVLARSDGQVKYAIVDVGGFLSMGAREVAIPWHELEIQEGGMVVYNGTADELRTAPEFDEDEFIGIENLAEWEQRAKKVFGEGEPEERARIEGSEEKIGRLSRELFLSDHIIGTQIENGMDDDLGEIEQLIINTMSGKASYVVADVGGFLGVGEREVALPWGSLKFSGDEEIVLAGVEDLESAPVFDEDEFLGMDSWEEWEREIEQFFGPRKTSSE